MVYLLLTPSSVIVNTTFVSSINYIFVFVINARNIHECCTQGFVHYKLTNCGLDQRRSDANTDQGRLKRQIFGICRETRIFYCPACTYFYQILNKCLSLRFQFFFIAVKLESDHIKPFWSSIASLRRKRNKVVKNKLKKPLVYNTKLPYFLTINLTVRQYSLVFEATLSIHLCIWYSRVGKTFRWRCIVPIWYINLV